MTNKKTDTSININVVRSKNEIYLNLESFYQAIILQLETCSNENMDTNKFYLNIFSNSVSIISNNEKGFDYKKYINKLKKNAEKVMFK